jgi:lipoate-protein ligase B
MPTEPTEVILIINTGMTLKGFLHVNTEDKAHRRINETLNKNTRDFIVLTEVSVVPTQGQPMPAPQFSQGKLPFLYINRQAIQLLFTTQTGDQP